MLSPNVNTLPAYCNSVTAVQAEAAVFHPNDSYSTASQESIDHPIHRNCTLADFDVLKLLGVGGSGKVYLVRDKLTTQLRALKIMPKSGRHISQLEGIVNEQIVQSRLSDTNSHLFASLVHSWHDETNFYLAMDYMPGGDMAIEMIRCCKFDEHRTRFYAAEMVAAIEALHEQNIIHRDVKPGNILFNSNGHVVLADFGCSKMFHPLTSKEPGTGITSAPSWISFDVDADSDSGSFLKEEFRRATNEVCGTPFYMSPQQHQGTDYSFDADVWGLGVSIYRMLTGRMPFGADSNGKQEIASSVSKDPLVFNDNDNISPAAQSLLRGLLAKNPAERLGLQSIKAHSYFNGIDWEKAAKHELKAPWTPYVHPPPKQSKATPPIVPGRVYSPNNDPYPQFRFNSSTTVGLTVHAKAPEEILDSGDTDKPHQKFFQKVGQRLGNIFSKKPAVQDPQVPESQDEKRTLRPLLLPGMVASRESTLSPVATQDEKTLNCSVTPGQKDEHKNLDKADDSSIKADSSASPSDLVSADGRFMRLKSALLVRVKNWAKALCCLGPEPEPSDEDEEFYCCGEGSGWDLPRMWQDPNLPQDTPGRPGEDRA